MALQGAGEGKDVADVVVDDENPLAHQGGVRAPRLLQQPPLRLGQGRLDPVEEQRRRVKQALGGRDRLDDEGLGQPPQLLFLLPRQVARGVQDNR